MYDLIRSLWLFLGGCLTASDLSSLAPFISTSPSSVASRFRLPEAMASATDTPLTSMVVGCAISSTFRRNCAKKILWLFPVLALRRWRWRRSVLLPSWGSSSRHAVFGGATPTTKTLPFFSTGGFKSARRIRIQIQILHCYTTGRLFAINDGDEKVQRK